VLFAGFSVLTAAVLAFERDERADEIGVRLAPWARLTLAVISILLGALAIALWIDPTALADASPFELPPLGGRFAGSWVALLAVLAGWGALRNRAEEAWLPVLAIVTLSAGALVAAFRTISDLEPAGRAAAYIAAITLLLASGLLLLAKFPKLPRFPLDRVVDKRDSPS
jgi:hypothetical protein